MGVQQCVHWEKDAARNLVEIEGKDTRKKILPLSIFLVYL